MARIPTPLTATPPPDLIMGDDGVPRSRSFDDVYYSVHDGLAETRAVFLSACGLPERWQNRKMFSIGETGFGTGLNFLATWELWNRTRPAKGWLHFFSIEKFPVLHMLDSFDDPPEIARLRARLKAAFPGPVKGHHRIIFEDDGISLTLCHDDIEAALENLNSPMDAWFLDGFSPSKNEDMWSGRVLSHIGRLSRPGAQIGTFTVAGHVRRGLAAHGFEVRKAPGHGKKRERLEAIMPGAAPSAPARPSIAIIGGGIAGAALCKAFGLRGIKPILISDDPELKSAASGNPAALVMPKLDLQDRPESRVFLSAYLFACRAYDGHDGLIRRGAFHAPKTQKEAKRFEKLVGQALLPEAHIVPKNDGVFYPVAMTLSPREIIRDWTRHNIVHTVRAEKLERIGKAWAVYGADGQEICRADHVIIAAGAGLGALTGLDIRPSRGQVTVTDEIEDLDAPFVFGGYALPLDGETLIGATHQKPDGEDPLAVRDEDHKYNIQQLSETRPKWAHSLNIKSGRSSVRATTFDRKPVIGRVYAGDAADPAHVLWVLGGLGSHGFLFAPLLAEQTVCEILEDPLPLPLDGAEALSVQRVSFQRLPSISRSP